MTRSTPSHRATGGKRAFHHPVDMQVGPGASNVLNSRHGMHHIAQRSSLTISSPPPLPPGATRSQNRSRLRRRAQCAAAANCASGLAERSRASMSAWMRSMPRACAPRSAAPAPAWCSMRGSGRSHRASPHAGRRWCWQSLAQQSPRPEGPSLGTATAALVAIHHPLRHGVRPRRRPRSVLGGWKTGGSALTVGAGVATLGISSRRVPA